MTGVQKYKLWSQIWRGSLIGWLITVIALILSGFDRAWLIPMWLMLFLELGAMAGRLIYRQYRPPHQNPFL